MSSSPGTSGSVAMSAEASAREQRFVKNTDESCRMFRYDWMERLSRVHPLVPHILYVPLITALVWYSLASGASARTVTGRFLLGVLLWTLVEYVIHRFVFHPSPEIEDDTRRVLRDLPAGAPAMAALPTWRHRFYFLVHGVHHDFPNDTRRLVMPPSVSIPLAVVFWLTFSLVFHAGLPAVFAGFVLGYLCYDTIHYLTHYGVRRTAIGRFLRRRHFRHHYFDPSKDFGVSSPLWDFLLGTLARRTAKH